MKTTRTLRGILTNASFASLAAAMLLSVAACDNKDYSNATPFDNVVYLDVAQQKDVANFTFNRLIETGQQTIAAQLSQPTGSDVNVSFKVDPTLVSSYNARLETDYTLLDSKYYTFSTEQAIIPQGKTTSAPVNIDFAALTGTHHRQRLPTARHHQSSDRRNWYPRWLENHLLHHPTFQRHHHRRQPEG